MHSKDDYPSKPFKLYVANQYNQMNASLGHTEPLTSSIPNPYNRDKELSNYIDKIIKGTASHSREADVFELYDSLVRVKEALDNPHRPLKEIFEQ